jgi:hypothetical protein
MTGTAQKGPRSIRSPAQLSHANSSRLPHTSRSLPLPLPLSIATFSPPNFTPQSIP